MNIDCCAICEKQQLILLCHQMAAPCVISPCSFDEYRLLCNILIDIRVVAVSLFCYLFYKQNERSKTNVQIMLKRWRTQYI